MSEARNQCAGCQAGWPIEWHGGRPIHVTTYPSGMLERVGCTAERYGVTLERPAKQWTPLAPAACDLCPRTATWQHPDGGLRCGGCPRPEL